MFYLILLGLVLFFYISLNKILQNNLKADKAKFEQLKQDFQALLKKGDSLKSDNIMLFEKTESIIELYEITKEVCKSLEEEAVLGIFKEKLKHYIKIGTVEFIKQDIQEIDYQIYKDQLIFPLNIGIKPTYFLAAKDVPREDQEKFYILCQQFLLGLRRVTLYGKLQDLATHDTLTGLLARRYFLERLAEEITRSEKFKLNFSFLMVDIDHFKECNDRYGHLAGDVVLKEIAEVIKENSRQIDIVARYGGEEFSIVLSETSKKDAIYAAERIRKSVEEKKIRAYDEELSLTISIGISAFPEDAKLIQQLIDKSDSALYRAKQSGRNRVCSYACT